VGQNLLVAVIALKQVALVHKNQKQQHQTPMQMQMRQLMPKQKQRRRIKWAKRLILTAFASV
jgi:hypothetical protein